MTRYTDLSVSAFNHPALSDMLERIEDKLGIIWDDDSLVISWEEKHPLYGPRGFLTKEEFFYDGFTHYNVTGIGPDQERVVFSMQPTELGRLPLYSLKINGREAERSQLNTLVFSDLQFGMGKPQTIGEYQAEHEAYQIDRYKPKDLDWD